MLNATGRIALLIYVKLVELAAKCVLAIFNTTVKCLAMNFGGFFVGFSSGIKIRAGKQPTL